MPFSLRTLGFVAVNAVLVTGLAACSVDVQQVFSSSNNDTGGGQGGQGGGAGGGGSQGGQGGGSTVSAGGSLTTTTTTTSTTTTTTTSTTSTTSTTTSITTNGTLACGEKECPNGPEFCCWDKWGIGTGQFGSGQCLETPIEAAECNTAVQQGGVQTVITCQTSAQCDDGQVCCGDVKQFQSGQQTLSYYPEISCRSSCDWPSRTMCKGGGDPICTGGTSCKASMLLPQGYFVCSMN